MKERELLARALETWTFWHPAIDPEDEPLFRDIRAYLAEPTQDEKPIAYWDTQEGKLIPAVPLSSERTCFKVPPVPLYLHPTKPEPAIRKPMTQKEIDKGFSQDWFYGSFVEGIRFAEKHHGIGGGDD